MKSTASRLGVVTVLVLLALLTLGYQLLIGDVAVLPSALYSQFELKSGLLQAYSRDLRNYDINSGYSYEQLASYDWQEVSSREFSGLTPQIELVEKIVSETSKEAPRESLIQYGGLPGSMYWLEVRDTGQKITNSKQFSSIFAPVDSQPESASFVYALKQGEDRAENVLVAQVSDGYIVWRVKDVSALSPRPACGNEVRVILGDIHHVKTEGLVISIGKVHKTLTIQNRICI